MVVVRSTGAGTARAVIKELAFGESDAKIKAIDTLVNAVTARPFPFLQSLLDGEVQTSGEDIVLVVKGDVAVDAYTGKVVTPLPETRDDVVVNNRMRLELTTAIAALTLRRDRASAWPQPRSCRTIPSEPALPAIDAALPRKPTRRCTACSR